MYGNFIRCPCIITFMNMPKRLPAILLILLAVAPYLPLWHAGFVWDDKVIYENPELRTKDGLQDIWFHPARLKPYEIHYWPVTHTSFWMEYQLWDGHPKGYHVTNILIHCINVLLLFALLRSLSIPSAWIAAAVFAVHPVHAESVSWISDRKDLLACMFILAAFKAFNDVLETGSKRKYFTAFVLFIAALLSKSIVIAFPFVLVIWISLRRKQVVRDDISLVFPFALVSIAYALGDYFLCRGGEPLHFHFTALEKVLIAGRSFWFYFFKLIVPVPLMAVYPRWNIDATNPEQYLFPLGVVAVFLILWFGRHRFQTAPVALFAMYFLLLAPVLGFLEFGFMRNAFVADRFQYIASLVPIIALTELARITFVKMKTIHGPIPMIFSAGLLIVFAVLTYAQAETYHDKETLFRHTLKYNPEAFIAHYNVAAESARKGNTQEAVQHYREVLRIRPDYGDTEFQLGTLLLGQGALEEAAKHLERDIRNRPRNVNSHINLGNAKLRQGDTGSAITEYQEALKIDPENTLAHNNLGFCYASRGAYQLAENEYYLALKSRPDSLNALVNLSRALMAQNKYSEAANIFQRILQQDAENIEALNNLAWILTTSQDLKDSTGAVALGEKACRLTGNRNADCLDTLSGAYAATGRITEAVETAERALHFAEETGRTDLKRELKRKIGYYREQLRH